MGPRGNEQPDDDRENGEEQQDHDRERNQQGRGGPPDVVRCIRTAPRTFR